MITSRLPSRTTLGISSFRSLSYLHCDWSAMRRMPVTIHPGDDWSFPAIERITPPRTSTAFGLSSAITHVASFLAIFMCVSGPTTINVSFSVSRAMLSSSTPSPGALRATSRTK